VGDLRKIFAITTAGVQKFDANLRADPYPIDPHLVFPILFQTFRPKPEKE
jgi:hypothetical protein